MVISVKLDVDCGCDVSCEDAYVKDAKADEYVTSLGSAAVPFSRYHIIISKNQESTVLKNSKF